VRQVPLDVVAATRREKGILLLRATATGTWIEETDGLAGAARQVAQVPFLRSEDPPKGRIMLLDLRDLAVVTLNGQVLLVHLSTGKVRKLDDAQSMCVAGNSVYLFGPSRRLLRVTLDAAGEVMSRVDLPTVPLTDVVLASQDGRYLVGRRTPKWTDSAEALATMVPVHGKLVVFDLRSQSEVIVPIPYGSIRGIP
jgi:hypothetical protein